MKLSRIIATGAVATLVGASVVLGANAASADDFYVVAPLPAEQSPYAAGWFTGGGSTGTISSGVTGLTLDVPTAPGKMQILNGTTPSTGLEALVAGMGMVATAPTPADLDELKFQIPIFTNPSNIANKGYTTLYPAVPGPSGFDSPDDRWVTSTAFGTYILGASDTLANLVAQMADDYQILAFGAIVTNGATATISSITWAGNTHWFLPAPTATITPASLSVDEMGETGVTGVFTGFVPGESVTASFATDSSGGALPGSYTADSNGAVTVTYSVASKTPGTYYLGAVGDDSDASTFGEFTITANALAETGAEMTPAVIAGSLLLLAGAGFSIIAMRRRKAAITR